MAPIIRAFFQEKERGTKDRKKNKTEKKPQRIQYWWLYSLDQLYVYVCVGGWLPMTGLSGRSHCKTFLFFPKNKNKIMDTIIQQKETRKRRGCASSL